MDSKEISIDIQALIGRTLIKFQRFEFLVHGIVSHFKTLPNYKRFKNLDANTI